MKHRNLWNAEMTALRSPEEDQVRVHIRAERIDSYETSAGGLLGEISGDTTFSTDVNVYPGGHAAMLATNGYLYLVTGTGLRVWEFSIGPRTPAALNCHSATISSLAKQ